MSKPFIEMGKGHTDAILSLIDPDKPVHVYKNLQKKCWSVRQCGKVILHTPYICLRDCEFRVSKKGRERVVREKKKNVHAYVKGYFCNPKETYSGQLPFHWDAVTYNPYQYETFVMCDDKSPCKYAKYVDCHTDSFHDFSDELLAQFVSASG